MSIYINEDCDKPGDCPAVDCEGRYDDDNIELIYLNSYTIMLKKFNFRHISIKMINYTYYSNRTQ